MANDWQFFAPSGGLKSDIDFRDMSNNDSPVTTAETGVMNMRGVGEGGQIIPGLEPVIGNDYVDELDAVIAQTKQFRIYVDTSTLTVDSQIDFTVRSPSGVSMGVFTYSFLAADSLATILAGIKTGVDAFVPLNTTSTTTTTGATTGYVDFAFGAPAYLDFGISNYAVTTGDITSSLEIRREAVDEGMVGEWKLIGSNNDLEDSFQFWTTKVGGTGQIVINGAAASAGLIEIATDGDHGLVTNEIVRIADVLGTTEANGIWSITVTSATTFTLQLSAFVNAYVSGGIAYSKQTGLGEIGVVYQTGYETHDYVRLLRSRELNFSTLYQVDARSKRKNDGKKGVYFTDNFNPMRVFYYRGDYITDGALSINNPLGEYELGFIASEIRLLLANEGFRIDWVDQIQTGGAVRSGNWRYSARFLTSSLSPTQWTDITNPVPVATSSIDGSGYTFVGDSANVATPKINVLEVTNNVPGVYSFVEIAALNYIGNAIQGYIIGRYVLTGEQVQQINHTGNETDITDLDPGTISQVLPPVATARNVEMLDNRLIFSNLTPTQFSNFTEWVETWNYALERSSIQPVGIRDILQLGLLTVGEYQTPDHVYMRLSHLFMETYRYGFRFRLKDGTVTPVFYFGEDITIDLTAPGGRRNAGSFDSFDLTDNNSLGNNPTQTHTVYVDFQDIDLSFLIDGIPAYDLITDIIPMRAPVVPTVWNGVMIKGVSGLVTGGGLSMFNGYYISLGVDVQGVGPNMFAGSGVPAVAFAPNSNPTYAEVTSGGYFTAEPEAAFFYCPDILFGQAAINYLPGDKLIVYGSPNRQYVTTTLNPGSAWYGYYCEYNGYTDVTANVTPDDIDDAVSMALGQKTATVNGVVYSNQLTFGDPVFWNTSDIINYKLERTLALNGGPFVDNNGAGHTDYGFYIASYYRPLLNQYGDPSTTEYESVGVFYAIENQTGIIADGQIKVYGDVHTQKSYIKSRYPAGIQGASPIGDIGFGMGFGFYSQNRVNAQMHRPATPTTTPAIFPELPIDNWLIFAITGSDPTNLFYNNGYTPRNGITVAEPFDDTAIYQTDWGNAIIWSETEADGSSTDLLRIFLPLNIKFLDYRFGKITEALNYNGQLVTLQETQVQRQYFDSTQTMRTDQGSEVIIGSGGVLSREGQQMTSFGCQHKWSVLKAKSEKGNDVIYFIDLNNKAFCRLGYNGNDALEEINGMKAFFANNLSLLWNKDNPASGQGIASIFNQRYREGVWTMRAINTEIVEWDAISAFAKEQVVRHVPTTGFSTFEQTGEFYQNISGGVMVGGLPPDEDALNWGILPHTNSDYYNEYTIIWSELKNEFQAFHTPKPLLYAPYKNGFLVPKPISNTSEIYIANTGTWTTWFGEQTAQAFFQGCINKPRGRKAFRAVSVNSDTVPFRMEILTKNGYSYTPTDEFEQREGNEFVGPVMNDATVTIDNPTGVSDIDTDDMRGEYAIFKFIVDSAAYNKFESFVAKISAYIFRATNT